MRLELQWQDNGANNKTLLVVAEYTPEEREALTATNSWERTCIAQMKVSTGLFRNTVFINSPTFRQFVPPGLRIPGLTDIFSQMLEGSYGFNRGFLRKNQQRMLDAIAPILEQYRGMMHKETAQQRDEYFGVGGAPTNQIR